MDLIESYKDDLKIARRPLPRVLLYALLGVLAVMPALTDGHGLYLATTICYYVIGVLGQNLLIGYSGQFSFGQAGFLAIGAFTFGHLKIQGVPFLLALLGAGLAAGLAGILVGIPSLRLKGPYLAISTLAFAVATYQILVNWDTVSGGRSGLSIPKLDPLFGFSREISEYYRYFLLAVGFWLLTDNIVTSYVGRAFIAVRDSDLAAEATGVNLSRYKLLAFAISSFYTGIHGGLYAQILGHLEVQMFNLQESINLLVAVIVGGVSSIEGSILGAVFVVLLPAYFSGARSWINVVFGTTVITVMLFEPLGLGGLWRRVRYYFEMWPFR